MNSNVTSKIFWEPKNTNSLLYTLLFFYFYFHKKFLSQEISIGMCDGKNWSFSRPGPTTPAGLLIQRNRSKRCVQDGVHGSLESNTFVTEARKNLFAALQGFINFMCFFHCLHYSTVSRCFQIKQTKKWWLSRFFFKVTKALDNVNFFG